MPRAAAARRTSAASAATELRATPAVACSRRRTCGPRASARPSRSRPPANRDPKPEEVEACSGWFDSQLALLRPRVIVSLGNFASRALLRTNEGITRLRGRVHPWRDCSLVPTYHPAAVLRMISFSTGFTDYGDYLGVAYSRPLARHGAVPVVLPYAETS